MNVLIVEDDPIIQLELARLIERNMSDDTRISTASNDKEAFKEFLSLKHEIIFMDVNLGEKSLTGVQVVKELQKIDSFKLFYISAYSDAKTITDIVGTEPLGYIKKPFHQKDILAALKIIEEED